MFTGDDRQKRQKNRCKDRSTLKITGIRKGAESGSVKVRQTATGVAGMHDIIGVIIMIITIIICKISFMLYIELVGSCLGAKSADDVSVNNIYGSRVRGHM